MIEDIFTLIRIAAKLFKQRHGAYPQCIGMDIARCRQVGLQYCFIAEGPKLHWQGWDGINMPLTLPDYGELVHVEIAIAVVEEDELLCKLGETMERMTVWSTPNGYHAISEK